MGGLRAAAVALGGACSRLVRQLCSILAKVSRVTRQDYFCHTAVVLDMLPLTLSASSTTCVTLDRQLHRSNFGLKVNAVHASALPHSVQQVFADRAGMYPRRLPPYWALFCTMQPNAGDGGSGGIGLGGDG